MKELSLHILDIIQNSVNAGASIIEIEIEEEEKEEVLTEEAVKKKEKKEKHQ